MGLSNLEIVRALLDAYQAQDREAAERLIADRLTFTSPQDDHIDKAAHFERCFPTADRFVTQEILKLVEAAGDGGLPPYEYELRDGARHRNTEYITVHDGQVVDIHVFFGVKV
jgi:ketosteroid isomerase-like protein